MYPPEEYLGLAEENLELPLGETAFMLIDGLLSAVRPLSLLKTPSAHKIANPN
jgi:hypothetical protein